MNPDAIIAAAIRNRARRMQQIARLQPAAADARQRATELAKGHAGARDVLRTIEQMQTLRFIPNFFPTPRRVIAQILAHAGLSAGMSVLEPSAGKGDLCRAARDAGGQVSAIEMVFALSEIVRAAGFDCECADFLSVSPRPLYDRVLMNPPFARGIDAEHIQHAFRFLRPGGRLVAVASLPTCRRLSTWSDAMAGYTIDLPHASFRNSDRSTAVSTGLVVANRPLL